MSSNKGLKKKGYRGRSKKWKKRFARWELKKKGCTSLNLKEFKINSRKSKKSLREKELLRLRRNKKSIRDSLNWNKKEKDTNSNRLKKGKDYWNNKNLKGKKEPKNTNFSLEKKKLKDYNLKNSEKKMKWESRLRQQRSRRRRKGWRRSRRRLKGWRWLRGKEKSKLKKKE